jgi:DNA ligase (NAD+)
MPDAATIQENSAALLTALPILDEGELERLVRHHNARYWDSDAPEIDDPTFDKLVEALRAKAPGSKALLELGESGAAVERRFAPVEHEHPMLSLDKCYDDETLLKWREKVRGPIAVTPKIDGVACALRYDAEGRLALAATRGSGKIGDDITVNARCIEDIPAQVDVARLPGPVEVRGEVYMRLSRFRERYAEQFANPRNLAAGALKQKDPEMTRAYKLSFFAFDVLGTKLPSERDKNAALQAVGFALPEVLYVEEGEDLTAAFRHYAERREALDCEIDGVVMKADLVGERERLGLTAHHPKWAIAYKLQGESAQTRIAAVQWSVGRSGVVTPVAVVDPVFVSGVTVTRASLHNAGYLEKLGVKRGALVELVRRGGVIPHVERVLADVGEEVLRPERCPSCGRPTSSEGDFLFCSEPADCPDVVRGRVAHFVRVIDVLGFGKKSLAALIDKGLVKEPADLFKLTREQLVGIERMGEVLAQKLLAELDARRRLPLPTFLTALGIEEVGPTVAEALCEHFPSLASLRAASLFELGAIHGIGPSIASSLTRALAERSEEIDHLLTEIDVVLPAAREQTGHPLCGKSVVFTGKLATMERKNAQKRVRDLGGKTPTGVTSELSILVVGDEGSPLLGEGERSTKQKKAEQLNEKGARIEVMAESDFVKLLES